MWSRGDRVPGSAAEALAMAGAVRRRRCAPPHLAQALASAVISESWAAELMKWTKDLPAELHGATDKILVDAAVAGASLDDLAAIAAYLVGKETPKRPPATR